MSRSIGLPGARREPSPLPPASPYPNDTHRPPRTPGVHNGPVHTSQTAIRASTPRLRRRGVRHTRSSTGHRGRDGGPKASGSYHRPRGERRLPVDRAGPSFRSTLGTGRAGFPSARGAGRDGLRPHPCGAVRWPARCLTQAPSSHGGFVCGAPSKAGWEAGSIVGALEAGRGPSASGRRVFRLPSGRLPDRFTQMAYRQCHQPSGNRCSRLQAGRRKWYRSCRQAVGARGFPRGVPSGPCPTPRVSTRLLAS